MCLGIPGRIVRITDASRLMALADVWARAARSTWVAPEDLDTLVGEWVLIHVGFAMSRIDEAEAEKTMQILHDLGEAEAAQAEIAAGDGVPA